MTEPTATKVHDPIHRASYSFRHDGDSLWVSSWLDDGAHLPEHFHPSLEERWEVLEGAASLKLDGVWLELTPEDGPVLVAPGVRHELRNNSGRQAALQTQVTPGGRLEEFLTESAWAAREGLYNARGLPTSLRGARWIAEFAPRFSDETVMCSPPPAVQRVVLPLMARVVG
jgi:mannose-6-phosphate isomerase-like protein (cupin superfamily)